MSELTLVDGVVDSSATTRHDLKTLPGAWIETRKLTFEEKYERMSIAQSSVKMEREDRGGNAIYTGLGASQSKVTFFEFKKAIVDHNIGDGKGGKLNFGNRQHYNNLRSDVGSEIENIIQNENLMDEEPLGSDSEE